jgi:hypothetical protein
MYDIYTLHVSYINIVTIILFQELKIIVFFGVKFQNFIRRRSQVLTLELKMLLLMALKAS